MKDHDVTEQAFKNGYEKGKQEVAKEIIAEFKDLVLNYVQDRDLLLVTFKNAVKNAEAELKKKYIGEKKDYPCYVCENNDRFERMDDIKPTNFDRITENEEALVEFMADPRKYAFDYDCYEKCLSLRCKECIKEWLQKECEQ